MIKTGISQDDRTDIHVFYGRTLSARNNEMRYLIDMSHLMIVSLVVILC